jgi:hypothetical protein
MREDARTREERRMREERRAALRPGLGGVARTGEGSARPKLLPDRDDVR